ncbi:unnamed protein product [Notodromas monacha]|uniref:S1 motif domain-containing protein n=1 Tax=Notodromas monacha TaxID=399045 RepID=A0A7R9BFK3_9CRUS|nr:unnamed protein product [Notodromas monacha]CAG0913873.1 unnamed protein product [Notodromas monacha]
MSFGGKFRFEVAVQKKFKDAEEDALDLAEEYLQEGLQVVMPGEVVCLDAATIRYLGEVGDVVVGRITEVGSKRWKVDVNSKMDAVLPLASVIVPGAENRRKTMEDEISMRSFLEEGDLVVAEIHNILSDGTIQLQARSDKYGKLGLGLMVKVSPGLVTRRKTHFHRLPCGVTVILSNNGYIWISPMTGKNAEEEGVSALSELPVS